MKYLLDTCVVSELIRHEPDPRVVAWLGGQPEHALYLSVLTFGEIRRGIGALAVSRKRSRLLAWVDELGNRFDRRILPVDLPVAAAWGDGQGDFDRNGRPLPVIDGLLAATVRVHGLSMVTRNTKDFLPYGIDLVNPWET